MHNCTKILFISPKYEDYVFPFVTTETMICFSCDCFGSDSSRDNTQKHVNKTTKKKTLPKLLQMFW